MKPIEAALRKRQDKGRYWWELRACAYWDRFDATKIMYQDIAWHPQFSVDSAARLSNNTVYFLPTEDLWAIACLNSPIAWWYSWRAAVHGKDEALRFFTWFLEAFPIPQPTDRQKTAASDVVRQLVEITGTQQETRRTILDWLRVQYEIAKPSLKLQSPTGLDSDGFVAEVAKVRGKKKPLTAAALKALRDEHAHSIEPARKLAAEALKLETQLSNLVNQAYGLTPEEVALLWETAPPRMPIGMPPC